MLVRSFFLMMIVLFTAPFSLLSKNYYTGNEEVVLIDSFEGSNSFISYVTIGGNKYIIKQKRDMKKQISIVRDALAAYIAQDLNIAHLVEVIAAKDNIIGKKYAWLPATRHTVAAGKTLREQPESKYHKLSLQQHSPEDHSLAKSGLTTVIIECMTWHEQLPIIVALDLFICNTDRHRGNLFYDPVTDTFCAIDMDDIFKYNLPELACKKLDLMINADKKQFTKKEIEALKCVRNTIKFLSKKYTSKKIIDKLHFFAQQAVCIKDKVECSRRMAELIAQHEEIIIKSCASVHQLIVVLDKIIKNFNK